MIINKRQWIHRITAVLLIVMAGMAATVQMTSAAENSSAKKSENTSTSLKEAQQEKAALEKALEKAKQTINELKAVSYTHLDVYKRQLLHIRRCS